MSRQLKTCDTDTPVVAVEGLTKSYGTLEAVKGVSFSVNEGEIFGILGPNGAGKSTTIECILGTRTPSEGCVRVLGMDPVTERQNVYSQVGVQFQDSSWQTGIRVSELCEATACLYDPVPDWKESLKVFELENRRDHRVDTLSGGERQKLAILLACIHDPRLIFLDELTTGLDPIARRQTWRSIRDLQRRGSSVILISHYMDEIEALCQRSMVLNEGELIACGTIPELMDIGRAETLEQAYINIIEGERL